MIKNFQTTFRCPSYTHPISKVRISYSWQDKNAEHPQTEWVQWVLDTHSGAVTEITNWQPDRNIPEWFTDTPCSRWKIESYDGNICCQYTKDICTKTEGDPIYCTQLSTVFHNVLIRDIWIGKYGYVVER